MATKNLTNDNRAYLLRQLMIHRVGQTLPALIEEEATLADRLYTLHFGREDIARMKALPNGWLPKVASITYSIDGERHELSFNGRTYGFSLRFHDREKSETDHRPAFSCYASRGSHQGWKSVAAHQHTIYEDILAFARKRDAYHEDNKNLAKSIENALKKFRTPAKLAEEWPEVRPFMGKLLDASAPLPAIPVATLNAQLGLPVEG